MWVESDSTRAGSPPIGPGRRRGRSPAHGSEGALMSTTTPAPVDDHYTIISADSHAGGSHAQYREYLDPKYLDDFDAWRGKYKNPFKDLQRHRPARPQLGQRAAQLASRRPTASSARCLPQHRAAVLPELRAVRRAAEARGVRAPARRHPRPQPLAGRLRAPSTPSAAPASARSSSTTSTTPSTTCMDQGARPARRRPARRTIPPDVDVGEAAVRPRLRPAVGGVRGPRRPGQRARRHRLARLRPVPGRRRCSTSPRSPFYSQRPFVHLLLVGRVRALPEAKFVMTEMGCAWVPPLLAQLDAVIAQHPQDRRHRRAALRRRARPAASRPPSTSSRTAGSA